MQTEDEISFTRPLTKQLEDRGFARSKLELESTDMIQDFGGFVGSCEALPVDPYDETRQRRRRYGRFILHAWDSTLKPTPIHNYEQTSDLNPTDGGVERKLPPLDEEQLESPFLRQVILEHFNELNPDSETAATVWEVGVHVLRYEVAPGSPCVASPPVLHKDGEPLTSIILLDRNNVQGGWTEVTDNEFNTRFRDVLCDPLELVVIDDSEVYHKVTSMEVAQANETGYRTVLLVDFTPMSANPNDYTLFGQLRWLVDSAQTLYEESSRLIRNVRF